MNCLICREAETIDGLITVLLERDEIRFVVHHAPARVCPHCGDSYVDETVAKRLLLKADERTVAGELDSVWEYE